MKIKIKTISIFLVLLLVFSLCFTVNLVKVQGFDSTTYDQPSPPDNSSQGGFDSTTYDQPSPPDNSSQGGFDSTTYDQPSPSSGSTSSSSSSILPDNYGLPTGTIRGIVANLLTWMLGILGVVGIIGFVISGIMYLLSTGNEGMIEKAKKAMVWSIVGVAVGISGYVIIRAINAALNASWFI